MRIGKYVKVPADHKRYVIDYTDWLDSGETIASYTLAVAQNSTGNPLVLDDDSIISAGKELEFYAGGGDIDTDYDALVTVTTSDGQIKEDTVRFVVKSPT